MLDMQIQFPEMLRRAQAEAQKLFPVTAKSGRRLTASNFRWAGVGPQVRDDFALHKKTKLHDRSLLCKLLADVELTDPAGKTIDRRDGMVVLNLPHATAKGTFIVDGKELQVVNQLRLRPGLYTRFAVDDDVETFVNTSAAGTYRVILERRRGRFQFRVGPSAHFPLTVVLRALGVGDGEMIAAWGRKIFDATQEKAADEAQSLKLLQKLRPNAPAPASYAEAAQLAADFLRSKPLDPDVNKLTLGVPFERVDGPSLLAASVKCLRLARSEATADDPESLSFKSLHAVEDFVPERLAKAVPMLMRGIAHKLDRAQKVTDVFHSGLLSEPVRLFFAASEFSRYADQTNPVEMAGISHLTTVMGEGGIGSTHAVRDEVRAVHPSHLGVLDAVRTPEGTAVGLTGSLAFGARKSGNRIMVPVTDAKTGRRFETTVEELERSVVAFPDQYDLTKTPPTPRHAKVKGRLRQEFREFDPSEVRFVLPNAVLTFGPSTNIIPFLHSVDGNRAGMGDRHVEQTVPLKNPDKPLVQAKFGREGYEELFGREFLPRAPTAGTVSNIGPNGITIRARGKSVVVPLHDHYPLNATTYLHDTPKVKVGDAVTAGQILADNNFTRDGSLALGANLRVAYVPYKGYNFEDGVVVSAGAATKLTSVHKYDLRLDIDKNVSLGLRRMLAHFPDQASVVRNRAAYDENGIVKPGTVLQPGEPAIAAVREAQYLADYDYAKLHRSLTSRWTDASVYWDGHTPAKVVDVVRTPSFARVIVTTEEPAQVGDKLSNKYGGKGIIVAVMPDGEMPHDQGGKPLDVLFNPTGLVGRVNPGQLLEAGAAAVAQKRGKTYLVENFAADNYDAAETVRRDRREAGLDENSEETVVDPQTGRSYPRTMVGTVHFLKLKHSVDKKFTARGMGEKYTVDEAPAKTEDGSAQRIGGLELYALMAGDASHFVRDAFAIKGQRNDDYWRAVQLGLPPPRPKTPFVSEKFLAYLLGAGVNLKRDGDVISAGPVTDAAVLAASNGRIENSSVIDAGTLKPERGGLFDPEKTGGPGGAHWTHIELPEPIVHPLMMPAAAAVAGLSNRDLDGLLDGSLGFEGDKVVPNTGKLPTGAAAVEDRLKKIDVDRELTLTEAKIAATKSAAARDRLLKRRRYLRSLKDLGMRPEAAYVNRVLPVIPARFRAVYPLPDGSLNVADPVHGYREVMMVAEALRELKALGVDDAHLGRARGELHAAVGGLVGTTEPLTRSAHFKGFLQQVKGLENKTGLFQGRVMSRPQDLSARSTIIPDPKLNLDDVGIPMDMALTIYRPFLIARLRAMGQPPLTARDMVDKKHPLALKALEVEMAHRPVLLNRAPSLHKFNVLAFKPRAVDGQAVRINPLIVKGYNADFDGDAQLNVVWIRVKTGDTLWSQVLPDAILTGDHMTARFGVALPLANGDQVAAVDLANFPRGERLRTTQGEHGVIHHYLVPEGVEVLAYDEQERRVTWRAATEWSEHPDRRVVVVTLKSGYQILTDEDPRAVYGVSAGSLVPMRCFPSQAVDLRMLVPRAAKLTETGAGGLKTWAVPAAVHLQGGDQRRSLNNHVALSAKFGHLLGVLIGNGWASNNSQVCLADLHGETADAVDAALPCLFERDVPVRGEVERDGPTGGGYGASRRHVWSSAAFCRLVEFLIGKGARAKHLPSFFLMAPRECRLGLLAGLIDTDGSVSVSHGKAKPQTLLNYSTVSDRLAREIALLSRSLGVKARITTAKTPAGAPCYVLNFTVADAVAAGLADEMVVTRKRDLLRGSNADAASPAAVAQDIVPITPEIATAVMKALRARPDRDEGPTKSLYVTVTRARGDGYISRAAAERTMKFVDVDPTWRAIVLNRDVTWDLTESVEQTEMVATGYDLTVPGFETFMAVDGVILSNTMGVHVPVTEEARREAVTKLLPSQNMLSPADGRAVHAPSGETALGVYLMTAPVGTPRDVKSEAAMVEAYRAGTAQVNDAFRLGTEITCPGRALLNAALPEDLRTHAPVTAKALGALVDAIAKKYAERAAELVSTLKDLGNRYVTEVGFSVSLRDLKTPRAERDRIMAKMRVDTKSKGFAAAASDAVKQLGTLVHSDRDNRLVQISSVSGALGGKAGQVTRMLGAPVAVMDHRGAPVPVAIGRSYAEGFDLGSYWATMPGVRKGLVDKGLSTADTGYLTKLLVQANIDNVVSEADCGTHDGIAMTADDDDLIGRYVAAGPDAGKVVTPEMQRRLAAAGASVTARSALKCRSSRGVCQKCFGDSENGRPYPVGYHLGVLAAQTVGEPSTQLQLRSFHTGGSIGGRSAAGFPRVKQLYHLPDSVPGRAPLATETGAVSAIRPAATGGWTVRIGAKDHFVPAELGLAVRLGQRVAAGDRLSTHGVLRPQDLLDATGDVDRTRKAMIADLDGSFRDSGVRIRRRIFETTVKPMTDKAEVTDPGDGYLMGVVAGDVLPTAKLDAMNEKLRAKIKYSPLLLGVVRVPRHGSDFIGRLMHERLVDTVRDAASLGLKADAGPRGHPVTRLALTNVTTDVGLPKRGRPA